MSDTTDEKEKSLIPLYSSKYSPMEKKILDVIPSDGRKINTLQLVDLIYDNKIPRYARESVLTCANALMRKSDENNEPWEIFKSKPRGPQPIYWWREQRK
jgi:hypothetical protein